MAYRWSQLTSDERLQNMANLIANHDEKGRKMWQVIVSNLNTYSCLFLDLWWFCSSLLICLENYGNPIAAISSHHFSLSSSQLLLVIYHIFCFFMTFNHLSRYTTWNISKMQDPRIEINTTQEKSSPATSNSINPHWSRDCNYRELVRHRVNCHTWLPFFGG